MAGLNPILVLDMWEHAWYLKHNFQKANYVKVHVGILTWLVFKKKNFMMLIQTFELGQQSQH